MREPPTSKLRSIIHVDMDAFYASVEQRDDPDLRGRPIIVGGTGRRGVVAAASYEARLYGVHSAMPVERARKLCPDGLFLRGRFSRYREVSAEIFKIFRGFTSKVEGSSLDEAFLDVTESVESIDGISVIGRGIKEEIARRTGLTASIGMAHNKLLAKLASGYDKPDGFVHVCPGEIHRFLDPLPVRRLPGIGARTSARLHDAGILTAGQLRTCAPDILQALFGERGRELGELAAGEDHRRVKPDRERRSISQETTFEQDLGDLGVLHRVISGQAATVAERLRDKQLFARTVILKLRSGGFSTLTRSQSLEGFTRDAGIIGEAAFDMLKRWAEYRSAFSVRLVGVGVCGLEAVSAPGELPRSPD